MKLPVGHTLPKPVEVHLSLNPDLKRLNELEVFIKDLALTALTLVERVEALEEENRYKVTIH